MCNKRKIEDLGLIPKGTHLKTCNYLYTGDVIYLNADECKLLGIGIFAGEYVVEDARDSGGWKVWIRELDGNGKYCGNNPIIQLPQCPGYTQCLPDVKVIRRMRKIFI